MQERIEGLLAKERYTMDDLRGIVALLRDPDNGCPWDKVQTHASIRKNFIEETYEVADAIDLADAHLLCEELGDVLLQVALHTQMEEEQGTFTFDDVCTGICKKLIARHPHIFAQGDAPKRTADEVLDTWEQIKRREKHREGLAQDLESVPRALPALMRAQKVAKRAAAHGIPISTPGVSGIPGASGVSGTPGTSSVSGPSGTSGTYSVSDPSGTSGASGVSSTSGASTTSGTPGTSGVSLPDMHAALQALAAHVGALQAAAEEEGAGADERRRLLGEVLFLAADAARCLGCDAEEALSEATERLIRRFAQPDGSGPD